MLLRARCAPTPAVARLGAVTAVRRPAALAAARPAPLSSVSRLEASFTGLTLAPARRPGVGPAPSRAPLTVVANSKTSMGCTKRGTRRRATRTSGFRARMATPSGRAIIKARRKKGRKVLCTKSLYRKP